MARFTCKRLKYINQSSIHHIMIILILLWPSNRIIVSGAIKKPISVRKYLSQQNVALTKLLRNQNAFCNQANYVRWKFVLVGNLDIKYNGNRMSGKQISGCCISISHGQLLSLFPESLHLYVVRARINIAFLLSIFFLLFRLTKSAAELLKLVPGNYINFGSY